MSICQSFSSNYHPCSQSRKISIGITVDSLAKKKPGAAKEDENAVPNAERTNHNKENSKEAKNKCEGVNAATEGKQTEATEKVSSPWITTRSFYQKAPASETVVCRKETSTRPDTGGMQKKPNGVKDGQETYSHQFLANQNSILQSGDRNQRKIDITYRRKGEKNGNPEGVGEFTFATACEGTVSDKAPTADKMDKADSGRTDTLRMKLWEILGTVSSPQSQQSNSETLDVGADKLKPKQGVDHIGDTVARPKHGTISSPKSQHSNSQAHDVGSNKLNPKQGVDHIGDTVSGPKHKTVSSPKSQHSNSQAHDVAADKLPKQVADDIGDTIARPRQNSDTIETDSENPNQPTSRRLTRSLTRKRASTKVQQNKTKTGPSSSYKQQQQKKNIFAFEEGLSGKIDCAINFDSSMCTKKKSQRKSSSIAPRKIFFSEKEKTDKPQRASYSSKSTSHAEKTSSLGNKGESSHSPREGRRAHFESKNKVQEKYFHRSSVPKSMNHTSEANGPTIAENRNQQEDCSSPYRKNVVDPPEEFPSPTFTFKTPILSPSPCSTPRTVQMEQDVSSPASQERRFTMGNIRSFRTLLTSNSDGSGSNSEESSGQPKDSLQGKPSPVKKGKDVKDGFTESPSEDEDPGSSEEGSPIINGYECHKESSPETGTAEKPNSMRHPTKKLRTHGGTRINTIISPLPSPKDIGESDWPQEPSEQNHEDGLTRAVTLFAFALDNFKKKMDSATRKKSSEILTSASDGILLQLQNVKSQIQTDVGKLTSISKSKRKRLETKFEEQQEQLKLIHEKFKEDIHHYLKDCRSTLEELEAHQIELKGAVKKQRTSHQKLLSQLEGTVETQLNDAQRRITAVHESAKGKMLQLKLVIAECIKDGILN